MQGSLRFGAGMVCTLVIAATACSSPAEPRSGVTLLITNTSCQSDQCTPQHILAFPDNQPLTPGGLWRVELGVVTAASACLVFPPSASFRVIGWSSDNTRADTTTFTWTTAELISLGADSHPEEPHFSQPSTTTFRPGTAAGWRVSLPGNGPVVPGPACSPD
jgi:hypothetical protein